MVEQEHSGGRDVAPIGAGVQAPRAVPVGLHARWWSAAPFHLLPWPRTERSALDVQFYTPQTARLAQTVASLSQPGDILWSNATYAGGLMATLAHRALSSGMFYEVGPARPFDPVAAAQWIVWFKLAPMPGIPPIVRLIHRYQLQPAAEDDVAVVFRNPFASEAARRPQAVIPWGLAFMLSCGLIGLILWDFRRPPRHV